MKLFFKKNNKGFTRTPKFGVTRGFTLVETLVSISIFSISILGLLSILASGISNTSYAKQKMTASYLAQEGIEYARNMRDTYVLYDSAGAQDGWNNFRNALPSDFSFPINSIDFPGFTRAISVSSLSNDEVKISSTVTWSQGSSQKSVIFTENLFNWIE